MKTTSNMDAIRAVMDENPHKVMSLAFHALEYLAQSLPQQKFRTFMEKAQQPTAGRGEQKQLSQQELNALIRSGAVKRVERQGDTEGATVIGHDERPLGKFKTPLPIVTDTGE